MRRGVLAPLLLMLGAGACGAPRPAVVDAPVIVAPPAAAVARVDALLARLVVPHVRVEVVVPLQSTAPRAITQNPPPPNMIAMHDDPALGRLVLGDDLPFERDLVRRALAPCARSAGAETEVIAVTLGRPPTAMPTAASPSARATCVATQFVPAIYAPPVYRLEAHVAFTVTSTVRASTGPIGEDSAEVDRRLASTTDPLVRARLLVASGALHTELASASTAGPSGAVTELGLARARFEEALGAGVEAVRGPALFGLGVVLEALRSDDAMIAYRALVCPAHYAERSSAPLEQDHPASYWEAWERVHFGPGAKGAFKPGTAGTPQRLDEETVYASPYEGCTALPGVDRATIAEAWDALGRFHEERDRAAGPYQLNRAATAYARAVADGDATPFTRLALGRVLYLQHRPRAAVSALNQLLSSIDASTSVRDAELRTRASQILGSALTFDDLDGAAPNEPLSDRLDIVDSAPNPTTVARVLEVVLGRLADPALVAPSSKAAPSIVFWAGWELERIGQGGLATRAFASFLDHWPMHPDAPSAAWELAQSREMIVGGLRPGTPDALAQAKLLQEARANLKQYGPGTAWASANASDPNALARGASLATAMK